MTPDEIKKANAYCQEWHYLTERIEVLNALAYQIANDEYTITMVLTAEKDRDIKPSNPEEYRGSSFKDFNDVWANFIENIRGTKLPIRQLTDKYTYKDELTEGETLEVLGILLRRLMQRRDELKITLQKIGVTV